MSSIPGTAKQWPHLSCRNLHLHASDSAHPGFNLRMSALPAPSCHCPHNSTDSLSGTGTASLAAALIPHACDHNTYFFRPICLMPREWNVESNLSAVCTCGCLSLQVTHACLAAEHMHPDCLHFALQATKAQAAFVPQLASASLSDLDLRMQRQCWLRMRPAMGLEHGPQLPCIDL